MMKAIVAIAPRAPPRGASASEERPDGHAEGTAAPGWLNQPSGRRRGEVAKKQRIGSPGDEEAQHRSADKESGEKRPIVVERRSVSREQGQESAHDEQQEADDDANDSKD